MTSLTVDHRAARCCGSGCSSPAWASVRRSRCSRSWSRTSVPFERLGVATSNLTFFRQIGGSVGLAIVGTLFAHDAPGRPGAAQLAGLRGATCRRPPGQFDQLSLLPGRRRRAGPRHVEPHRRGRASAPRSGVAASRSGARRLVRAVRSIAVEGFYGAFSLAVAQTFYLGVMRRGRLGGHEGLAALRASQGAPRGGLRAEEPGRPRPRRRRRAAPSRTRRLTSPLSQTARPPSGCRAVSIPFATIGEPR